ncbi:MAG: glycosyltransferase family A protein, partial [Cyanobacteria bacterium J06649_5]
MPEVSIVIPAYNAMEYLPHTVESVLQQTFRDFEVVIVNDGSTDNIKYWFDQAVRDPRFRLISQENQGIAGARNAGIANTQGEFIAFLDADDLWHP